MQHHQHGHAGNADGDATYTDFDSQGQVSRQASRRSEGQPPIRRFRWPIRVGIGLLVLIVLIGAIAAVSKQFRHQVEISLARQPTPYTQLYFSSPSGLPSQIKVGKANTFAFTIVNDEDRTFSYTYTVTFADPKSHGVTSKGTLSIGDGQQVTRQVQVTPKDPKSKYVITVTLEGMNQSILFHAEAS
jgi:uncharacterized membrane protein